MTKIIKFFIALTIHLAIFTVLIAPAVSIAANTPLVPCTNTVKVNTDSTGKTTPVLNSDGTIQYDKPCGFPAFLELINNIIGFILKDMALPIAAIMFCYAGFLLVTAGGEAAHARTKAKGIFTNAVIGLVIAVAAWLIVKTLLSILGYKGALLG